MSTSNLISPKQAIDEIWHCAARGVVPYLRSSPGMGKSAIIHQIAAENRLKMIDLRLSQCTPEDLQGFPMRQGDKATFVPFDVFPIEGDEPPEGYEGWMLLLDELSSANKQVQAAAYKIILDRMTGSFKLHERVIIVAAGNLETDKAVVVSMSTALQSRLVHYTLDVDPKGWVEWAIRAGIDKRIIAYISYKPSMLMKFDPNHTEHTFPCPRTWEILSKLIQGDELGASNAARIAGAIGQGTSIEFLTFAREFDRLPKLQDILDAPSSIALPSELATRYATAVMLSEHLTEKTADLLLTFMKRLDVEMQIIFIRMALMANPKLPQQSNTITQYMKEMVKYLS
jgi:hypothetical protein